MTFIDALRGRKRNYETAGRDGARSELPPGRTSRVDDRQSRIRTMGGFKPILDYVDLHQRDGYPDSPLAAFGSRYQLVQMLSLRDPLDARWLNDTLAGEMPYWLRTTYNVHEEQRFGMSPQPPASPYQVIDWHQQAYAGVPEIGHGPGTILMRDIPMSQMAD